MVFTVKRITMEQVYDNQRTREAKKITSINESIESCKEDIDKIRATLSIIRSNTDIQNNEIYYIESISGYVPISTHDLIVSKVESLENAKRILMSLLKEKYSISRHWN